MGLFEKFKNGLRKTAQQLTSNLDSVLKGSVKLSDATLEEMEERLVAADMGTASAHAIVGEVKGRIRRDEKVDPSVLSSHLREAVSKRLLKAFTPGSLARPVVVLLVGVNGAGKTTTAGKLAS